MFAYTASSANLGTKTLSKLSLLPNPSEIYCNDIKSPSLKNELKYTLPASKSSKYSPLIFCLSGSEPYLLP